MRVGEDVPQEVWVAFAGWIRHIDAYLAKADQLMYDAEAAMRKGEFETFGTAFGTSHGQIINARKDIATALSIGLNLPSQS